ncbi:hypothetical protein [Coriobacterium glomerans]|nr:hypothetical protein [Coriobacterium glomerans]
MTDLTESLRSACDRSSERVALDINQSERQVEGLNPATDQLERAVEELKPRTLEDDPAFMRIHDILKNQFDAFSRFAESADEAAARNFRLTVTSVLIAVGSLLIAVISLIRAFIG